MGLKLKSVLYVFLGALLYSLSFNMFFLPCEIVTGGAGGIATVLNILYGLPTGMVMFVINIPLFAFYTASFGKRALAGSVIGVFLCSVLTDITSFVSAATEEKLVASIVGGAVMGAGVGILFSRGVTTGGGDLLAHLIKRKLTQLSVGKLIMMVDIAVVLISAIVLGNFRGVLYSIIAAFTIALSLDLVEKRIGGYVLVIADVKDRQVFLDLAYKRCGGEVFVLRFGKDTDGSSLVLVLKKTAVISLFSLLKNRDTCYRYALCDVTEVSGEVIHPQKDERA